MITGSHKRMSAAKKVYTWSEEGNEAFDCIQ